MEVSVQVGDVLVSNDGGKLQPAKKQLPSLLKPHLKDYCPASNLAFNEKVRQLICEGNKVYHLAFGQSPFPVTPGAVKALQEHASDNAYLPVQGIPELRSAICEFHCKLDGLTDLKPENVIVGPGSKELIYLMLCVFNGDVMVLSPSWTTYKPQSQLAGHKAIVIHTKQEDEWRLTPSLVEQVVMENKLSPHRLLIMCNPDNPTGTSYQAHHLNQLSEVFRKHNIIVLSDEIYARLSFEGKHESIAKFYPEGTILSTGISKWASAGGWRLGYHIYPDKLSEMRKAVASGASHTYSCAPAPVQHAALWLYKWTDEVQDYVLHERRILHAVALYTFRELTSVGVKVVMSTAGYYMFPNFEILRPALNARGITTGNQMCDAIMNEASVALMAGGPAFLRPVDDLTVRLCYINFDGGKAMQASRKRGTEGPLDDDFVVEHGRTLMEAIQALKKWVETQLDSERE